MLAVWKPAFRTHPRQVKYEVSDAMMNNKKPADKDEIDEPSQLSLAVGSAEQEVGARLRQRRLKRRISIEDAARALKLAPSTLLEIEEGELGRFESLYRRGYLRNYARFLGLDPEPLLERVQAIDLPPLKTVLPVGSRGQRFDRFLKIATYVIVTTLIIPPLVLIYIQGGLDFLDRDRALVVDLQDSDVAPVQSVSGLAGPVRPTDGGAERDAAISGPVTASAIPLNALRPVRDLISEQHPLASEQWSEALPGDEAPDPRSVLQVELLDDSWLEVYAADGRRLEFDLLRAGDQRRFVAEAPFRLLVGRGNAVRLSVDGEAVQFAGQDRGDVVRFQINADGAVLRD